MSPDCSTPTVTPCLPPRRIVFGPTVDAVLSTAAGPLPQDFALIAQSGGVTAPMRVVARVAQSQAVGEPGDVVLIQGHTLSFYASVQTSTEVRAIDVLDIPPERPPHAPGVKLRVQRCSWPGWIYFDSNSHIYMPGGEPFDIQVMAPSNWTQIPGIPQAEPPFDAQFVDVRVTACVQRCCPTRRTQLTMFGPVDESQRLLVPPHAIELQIFAGQAGAPFNSIWSWETTNFAGGDFGVNGGFVPGWARPGDAEALIHGADGGTVNALLVWAVE